MASVHSIRLDLERIPLCERENELQRLSECVRSNAAVFLHGESGAGKSALLNKLLDDSEGDYMCAVGKFEEFVSEPLSAILTAMNEVIEAVLKQRFERDEWTERITTALESEAAVLLSVLPRLADLLGDSKLLTRRDSPTSVRDHGRDRFRLAMRTFLRAVSEHTPVLVVLDDLQWADKESFDMLETLLQGRTFAFVGAHRPVGEDSPLAHLKSQCLDALDLVLPNLTLTGVSKMLQALLRRDEDDVAELAGLLYRKTLGNPFFAIQFLQLLERRELLFLSLSSYQWKWQIRRIEAETDISDNVAAMVAAEIQTLPEWQRHVLNIAACLGVAHFDTDMLVYVLSHDLPDDAAAKVRDGLEAAVAIGLLERLAGGKLKFSHDQIRDGALQLSASSDALQHLKIGMRLHELMKARGSTDLLFLAVRHLNLGSSLLDNETERVQLAALNLDAAEHAIRKSSFYPACDFLRAGRALLGPNAWQDHHDLMAALSNTLARMEFCCGRWDESLAVADDVLANTSDFQPVAVNSMVLSLFQQGQAVPAIEVALKALAQVDAPLDCRAPPRRIEREIKKMRNRLRNQSDEQLLHLPNHGDAVLNMKLDLLNLLGSSIIHGNPDRYSCDMVFLRMLQLTLDHGQSESTGLCWVAFGLSLSKRGLYDEALRYGKIGLHYAAECKRPPDVLAHQAFYYHIFHWREDFQSGVEPASRALKACWDNGVIDQYLWNGVLYFRVYFCSGLRLQPLAHDMRRYVDLLREYKQNSSLESHSSFFQMVANFMGEATSPLELTGEFMNQDESQARWTESGHQKNLHKLCFYRMVLAVYFGDFDLAEDLANQLSPPEHEYSDVWRPYLFFFRGLIALVLAQERGSRKLRRQGQAVVKQLEQLVRGGAVNCHHMLLLLRAELAASTGSDPVTVRDAFDAGIGAAGKLGLLHNQALMNERAGVYCVRIGDDSWAGVYLERARDLYEEWEGFGKVSHMLKKYRSYLRGGNQRSSRSGGSFRGRERLKRMSLEPRKCLDESLDSSSPGEKPSARAMK